MHLTEIDTPALVIDLDVLEANIRRAQEYCTEHGQRFRPHMKTHKLPEIARMQVAAGAVGLTCAKLGEAEVMADAGIQDLMVAYPIWGAPKLRRLADLARRVRMTVVFDSAEVALGISTAVSGEGLTLDALVEVDSGMHRCGLAPGEELLALCRRVQDLPGLRFAGIMTYQGYITGSLEERKQQMLEEDGRLRRVLDDLGAAGLGCEVVSGAASPNLFLSHLATPLTENRAGTYVFNDRNMVSSGAVGWGDCALRVAATVVSRAVPGQIIIDGGSKTFSSDRCAAWPGHGRIVEDPDLLLLQMNEEHGYVHLNGSSMPHALGDRLHLIPNHVCTTVNMHDEVWVARGERVLDRWTIAARGKVR
jgi:D-serine deaminase-like pyridoxal phosphate-dependent protein